MKILTYLRASIFRSSSAAFELAKDNNKYRSFAERIITVKNERLYREVVVKNSKRDFFIQGKIPQYNYFLEEMSKGKTTMTNSDQQKITNLALTPGIKNIVDNSIKSKKDERNLNEPTYFSTSDRTIILFGKENLI
ncbi:hypothetical protein LOZ86_15370 [Pectobacterium parvum]|uniref:hypothetical protein n=1 Tax=Pectobacterium parvum TaxID=2778550 RepID=UPI000DCFF438|nr:hypothetical protein [Pectobacterium parvum]MCU1802706.1 hypothetical protein [Pectobacterium parvum]UFK38314.1 hypothetical protein LOZ86_15370 [Pectobacterium parvum]